MTVNLTIALGYRELNGLPKVLYVGNSVDEAREVINAAGNSGKILEGRVLRNLEDRAVYKHRFAPKRELVVSH